MNGQGNLVELWIITEGPLEVGDVLFHLHQAIQVSMQSISESYSSPELRFCHASRTMGKRGRRVEFVLEGVILQEPCNLNWESMEERTDGQ